VTLSGSETTFPPRAGDARRVDVRITALEAIPFAVPYRRPAGFASGTVTTADNVLVRVHTDAGLVGQAEAQPRPYTYGETQASIVHTVRATLEDLLVGLNPLDTEAVNARCARVTGNHVARGAVDLEGAGRLATGDAVRVTGAEGQRLTAVDGPAEVLVWEMHAALSD